MNKFSGLYISIYLIQHERELSCALRAKGSNKIIVIKKVMELSGGSGGSNGGDASDPHRRKKCYHRHTAHQIQRLESIFRECPHPDEKTRSMLSRELGMHPRQIKFWFQNRRTQLKAQHERADNCSLRSENDRIRCENIAIREALKNVICPSCGGGPQQDYSYFDEHKLRMENSHLKDELDRVSSIAAKYIGRPISQLLPIHVSPLDLSMSSFGGHEITGVPLDLDLVPGTSSGFMTDLPFPAMSFSDMDRSLMADMAANAMDELVRLLRDNESLWIESSESGRRRDFLNMEIYERSFSRAKSSSKNPNVRTEASRDSGIVIMNALALVDMFMDARKYMEFFPTMVSRARTIEVISSSSGVLGSHSGTLQLMYEELQLLSPLAPTRKLYFLRFCHQIDRGSWIVVDVSYDIPHQEAHFDSQCKACHLPSGCLIQDIPNGYSKVTWVEHWEVEERAPVHGLYKDLIHGGFAFGAERWLSTLQRMCERFACSMVSGNSTRHLGGVMPSPEGKRSMMKLAQRMVSSLCSSISPSNGQQWATVSTVDELEVRATVHRSTDPGNPNRVVLSASATVWLPVPHRTVFDFFRDERNRPRWDVLSRQNPVQEVAHIANGSDPGNCVSVLRAHDASENTLILQESCTDSSGSLVAYCPVDLPAINVAMSGEDSSHIPLTPSGFTISPDGKPEARTEEASSSSDSNNHGRTMTSSHGSLTTVVYQILLSGFPSGRMTPETVTTVSRLIGDTVQLIKAAFEMQQR